MMMPSCSVISDQSPWRQTFGYFSKYAARYREPSGSFQKPIGIEGKGRVQTSSPFSPFSERPCSSNTSTAMPSPFAWISPRQTGLAGLPSTKRDDVGAARDGREADVALHVLVDVVEAF